MENFVELNEINMDAFSPRNVLPDPDQELIAGSSGQFNRMEEEEKPKNTGTIPKTTILPQIQTGECSNKLGNDKGLTLDLNRSMDGASCSYDYRKFNGQNQFHINNNHNQTNFEDDAENCLDCTEKEFLMQTKQDLSIQKVCRTCHIKQNGSSGQYHESRIINSCSSETDIVKMKAEHIALKALNKIDELKTTPPNTGYPKSAESIDRNNIDAAGVKRKFQFYSSDLTIICFFYF